MTHPDVTWNPITNARNMDAVGYDEPTREMQIRYRDGTIYRYGHVPGALFKALLAADDPDAFLRKRIMRDHPARRVAPEPFEETSA